MSGGYQRCSCNLITGTSGTGKTTFACSLARSASLNGERVFYLNFEESLDAMSSCMLSPGIDLRPSFDSGRLRFLSAMPESQGIEEHLIQSFRIIEEFEPSFLIVDAISACRRMGRSMRHSIICSGSSITASNAALQAYSPVWPPIQAKRSRSRVLTFRP